MSKAEKSAFVAQMDEDQKAKSDNMGKKTLGENGAPEYTAEGVGDPRVALFFKLVRNIPTIELERLVADVFKMYEDTGDVQLLVDLFVLAFHTRGTRGLGKGEKKLFVELVMKLNERFPLTVLKVVELVPHYGYYKDWLLILEKIEAVRDAANGTSLASLARHMLKLFAAKLEEDAAELKKARAEGRDPKLSLAGKWAPRDGNHFQATARQLAALMFPDASENTARRLYRKQIAALNSALTTPEVLMSAHRYAEIDFGKVASLCLNRQRKAFLNEKKGGKLKGEEEVTGNRFPTDPDRVAARQNLRTALVRGTRKVKGAELQPHELVQKVLKGAHKLTTLEKDLFEAQWVSLREMVQARIAEAAAKRVEETGGEAPPSPTSVNLGKIVPLVDVSGSMSGTPMWVAISLGILVSELTHPAFRDRMLTFEAKPRWHSFADVKGLVAKAQQASAMPWGGNTDFALALDQILDVVIQGNLRPDEVPDLIVFSDMQFDQAAGLGYSRGRQRTSFETHFERIQRKFHDAGVQVCGEPYPAPRIIFWNLRGDTVGFPAQADTENVQMLSGFSPSLLKLILACEDIVGDEKVVHDEDGTTRVVKEGPTPYMTFRKAMDDETFHPVRVAIAETGEGVLGEYFFEHETDDGFAVVDG